MKSVLVRGPVFSQSGYGVHSRQIARWLVERGNIKLYAGATPWGNTPWFLDPTAENGLIGKLQNISCPLHSRPDVSFQIQLPNEWDPQLAHYNVGITAGIETDRANPSWISSCNKMDEIVVPSEHVKKSLLAAGQITIPIHVIPESFHDSIMLPDEKLPTCPLPLNLSTEFNFLIFGQITGNNPENDRKNIFYTIKWLCEEFKDDPNVGIVFKTNTSRNTKIDRKNIVDLTTKLLNEVRQCSKFPRVHLVHGALTENEVATIYRHPSIKALVSLTRGEGYGLPILEAAASGLPVIATGWSGHMDFMKHGKFIQVYHDLKEIHQTRVDDNLFMKGSRWAEASGPDFKRRARKLYNSPKIPKEWADQLQEKLLKDYNFNSIRNKYEDIFKDKLTS